MKMFARLGMRNHARRVVIIEAYLASIAADEPVLVKMFTDHVRANGRTNKLMKATARRIDVNSRRARKWPPRQVLFGNAPLPIADIEVLCGIPMPRDRAQKIVAMNADDRTTAMAAHFIEYPEHKGLFQNWLKGSHHGCAKAR